MAEELTETIDRAPPLGIFNFAESYRIAADILAKGHRRELHFDSPMRYLYYHAIELYLKSFLRSAGMTVEQMKDELGHYFEALTDECITRGLSVKGADHEVLDWIGDHYMDARYLTTGSKSVASIERLSQTAASLAETVGRHLIGEGVALRPVQKSPFQDVDSQ